jgi:hypothetical protein
MHSCDDEVLGLRAGLEALFLLTAISLSIAVVCVDLIHSQHDRQAQLMLFYALYDS